MSHRTHSDGVPAPRRTTRAMFHSFLKSHTGGGVVEREAKAGSPPHVAVQETPATDTKASKPLKQLFMVSSLPFPHSGCNGLFFSSPGSVVNVK